MSRDLSISASYLLPLFLACVLCSSGCASLQSSSTAATDSAPDGSPSHKGKKTAQICPTSVVSPFVIPFYPTPSTMDLCGERVPLDVRQVMERFDKEFTLVVYNHAQVYLWFKRMERYFPWLESQLKCNGLPDDLKYVAIAESDLLPNASSPKGAAGPWQFMPRTGSHYGLDQKGAIDERYDFEQATHSALSYLVNLHDRFNNWTLAIAAYNCGEGRIQESMRSQKTTDFYSLKLPRETERYVLRILAIKAVLGSPTLYGYDLPQGEGYPPMQVDRTCVTLRSSVPVQAAADAAGTTLREIRRLNPSLRSNSIPPGTHVLKLPKGTATSFESRFPTADGTSQDPSPQASGAGELGSDKSSLSRSSRTSGSSRTGRPAPAVQTKTKSSARLQARPRHRATKHHVVRKGETLSAIARRYDVSVRELKHANKSKGDMIAPGQRLLIP